MAECVSISFPPVESKLAQSCRCNFHFNKEASVADPILKGAFSISQGVIETSVHRAIGSAPGNASVISVKCATRSRLFCASAFGLNLGAAYTKGYGLDSLSIWSRGSRKEAWGRLTHIIGSPAFRALVGEPQWKAFLVHLELFFSQVSGRYGRLRVTLWMRPANNREEERVDTRTQCLLNVMCAQFFSRVRLFATCGL